MSDIENMNLDQENEKEIAQSVADSPEIAETEEKEIKTEAKAKAEKPAKPAKQKRSIISYERKK